MNRKQEESEALEIEQVGPAEAGGPGLTLQGESFIPDVRMSGEDSILEGLGGHPAHGQQPFSSFAVIVCLIDVSRHTEVCKVERKHITRVTLFGQLMGERRRCTILSWLQRRALHPWAGLQHAFRRPDVSVGNVIRQKQ